MPKCEYESWATESTYAYAPVVEVAKAKEKEKVKTAVLSTTHKVQAREAKKAEQKAAKDGVSSPRVSAPMPTPEPVRIYAQDNEYIIDSVQLGFKVLSSHYIGCALTQPSQLLQVLVLWKGIQCERMLGPNCV